MIRPMHLDFRNPKEKTGEFVFPQVKRNGLPIEPPKPYPRAKSTFPRTKRFGHVESMSQRTGFCIGPGSYDYPISTNRGRSALIKTDSAIPFKEGGVEDNDDHYIVVNNIIVKHDVTKPFRSNSMPTRSPVLTESSPGVRLYNKTIEARMKKVELEQILGPGKIRIVKQNSARDRSSVEPSSARLGSSRGFSTRSTFTERLDRIDKPERTSLGLRKTTDLTNNTKYKLYMKGAYTPSQQVKHSFKIRPGTVNRGDLSAKSTGNRSEASNLENTHFQMMNRGAIAKLSRSIIPNKVEL